MNILQNAHRLPVLDWNLNFFGGHEQSVPDSWVVPLNKHQAFELIYVLRGQERIQLEKHNILINRHEFVLIPPGFNHVCFAVHDLTYFCFHFDIDEPNFTIHLLQNSPMYFPSSDPVNQKITPILNKMKYLINPKELYSFEDKMVLQIYLSQMLLSLNTIVKGVSNNEGSNKSKFAKLIAEKIKSELNDHVLYFTNISNSVDSSVMPEIPKITSIISSLRISPGYGNRIFKEVYGTSPREYMSKLKLKWAQQMLAKPQFTVSEVALALGYQNSTHFSRQFKRWTGISPKKYGSIVE